MLTYKMHTREHGISLFYNLMQDLFAIGYLSAVRTQGYSRETETLLLCFASKTRLVIPSSSLPAVITYNVNHIDVASRKAFVMKTRYFKKRISL